MADPKELGAYIVTGPTSGIGRAMALELANLVGRAPKKRDEVRRALEKMGARAVPVVCDLSDIASVRRAARRSSRCGFRSSACSTMQACSRRELRRPLRAGT